MPGQVKYGYAGNILRLDVTARTAKAEPISDTFAYEWIGGTGFGVKIVTEEVPPSVQWNEPGNKFVVSGGALTATSGLGSGCVGVVTKGAMTGGINQSQANGYLGPFLRFCGYDSIVIEGQSKDWIYIYIDEEKVEFRSAEHLRGKDTVETQDILHKEHGTTRYQMSVFCIGPAGENLVNFACLVGDYGHVAAHNGNGAVLGSKRVKAIAVRRGGKSVENSDRKKLSETAKKLNEASKNSMAGVATAAFGTIVGYAMGPKAGVLPVKNLTTSLWPKAPEFDPRLMRGTLYDIKRRPCFGCNWTHCVDIKFKDGPYKDMEEFEEPEYELMAAFSSLIGNEDVATAMVLSQYVDRLGMDGNETGWVAAWCIECFEKGYFKKEDFDGLELHWGDTDGVKKLMDMICHRKGIGDILAGGNRRAAEHMGKDSPAYQCAVFTYKGNTPRGHDHRVMTHEYLDVHTSSSGTVEVVGGFLNVAQHGLKPMTNPFDYQQVAANNAGIAGRRVVEDSLGVCRFMTEEVELVIECMKLSTGFDYNYDEFMRIGRKIMATARLYNISCGITTDKEFPSPRYGSPVVDGPGEGKHLAADMVALKSLYFELMGWDPATGIPLPETLEKLGMPNLKPVAQELLRA